MLKVSIYLSANTMDRRHIQIKILAKLDFILLVPIYKLFNYKQSQFIYLFENSIFILILKRFISYLYWTWFTQFLYLYLFLIVF